MTHEESYSRGELNEGAQLEYNSSDFAMEGWEWADRFEAVRPFGVGG